MTSRQPVCRGYITARPVRGSHVPQRVQNLVVRDYTQRNNLEFRLSEVEYLMPGCYIMLNSVVAELPDLDGVVAYSLFMMPQRAERRRQVWQSFLEAGKVLHFAVENFALSTMDDLRTAEDILSLERTPQTLFTSPES